MFVCRFCVYLCVYVMLGAIVVEVGGCLCRQSSSVSAGSHNKVLEGLKSLVR